MTERLIIASVGTFAIVIGCLLWQHERTPRRPEYVLLNETDQHPTSPSA